MTARQASARECVKREGVFGYAICGMATGELPEQSRACLQTLNEELPADAPKLMQGALNPISILEGVSYGIDLFDATYATTVSGLQPSARGTSKLGLRTLPNILYTSHLFWLFGLKAGKSVTGCSRSQSFHN